MKIVIEAEVPDNPKHCMLCDYHDKYKGQTLCGLFLQCCPNKDVVSDCAGARLIVKKNIKSAITANKSEGTTKNESV